MGSELPQSQIAPQSAVARRHVGEGDRLFAAGDYQGALVHYQQAVRLWTHPACHYKLAIAAWRTGDSALAITHLLETVRLEPGSRSAHEALTQLYMEQGDTNSALEHSRLALTLAPNDPTMTITRGSVLAEMGHEQAAWELIRPLITGPSTPPWAAILYGKIAGAIRQEAEASQLAQSLLDQRLVAGPEASTLHFVTAALLDRLGRYDDAFEHARLAHESNRRPYDPDRNTRLTDGLIQFFTKPAIQSLPKATHHNSRPVFIVGMPRSGTSLVEQILASHPDVYGAGELSALQEIACSFNGAPWSAGEPFPASLKRLSVSQANQLAQPYLDTIAARNSSARYVTDKFPLNCRDLWLVQLLFPQAHVIHCVRDPRDTCLSCYMTDFASGNEFAQDLTTLAAFYRDYQRLMEHWGQVLELPVLQVTYELMVEDLEGQARRMLDFLDLPWDDRCLRFYANRRHVATASQSQVRRPIYRSSLGRWRHYQKHLGPLLQTWPAR